MMGGKMGYSEYKGHLIVGELVSFLSKRVINNLKQQELTMKTKELVEIGQAYLDGKKIQWKDISCENIWKDCSGEPTWHPELEWRIKPEPKYRPLKSEELHELKGKWIISNKSKNIAMVTGINQESTAVLINNLWWSASDLFSASTFEDGSPVGKLEE